MLVHRVLHLGHLGQVVDVEALALHAVEEVAHGEQHGEHVAEGAAAAQVLDAHLEVVDRLRDLRLDRLVVELEGPEREARPQLRDGRQRQQELLGRPQRDVGVLHLRLEDLGLLLLRRNHRQDLLESLAVDDAVVHLEDSGFDGARRRQHRHADVDGVGALRVQHDDLLLVGVLLLR